jgi:hypothetical protein
MFTAHPLVDMPPDGNHLWCSNLQCANGPVFPFHGQTLGVVRLAHSSRHEILTDHFSWAFFYYGLLPFITVCVSGTGTVLYAIGRGSSLYSLVIATLFFVGWWVANGFYIQCDWITGYDVGYPMCK